MVSTGVERSAERTERGATRRLTVAQAIVEYLQVQYSERDGQRRRLIPAIWGIFGHGNVAGLGQALVERGRDLPYYQPFNEQSMVHTAIGFAKANLRLATLACTSSIGPGATNMVTGAATATINRIPVLLLPPTTTRPATRVRSCSSSSTRSRPTCRSTTASARSAASSTASPVPSSS